MLSRPCADSQMMYPRLLTSALLAAALLALASPSEATCRAVSLNAEPTHQPIAEAMCELAEAMGVDEVRLSGRDLTFRFSPAMTQTMRMALVFAATKGAPEQAVARGFLDSIAKSLGPKVLAIGLKDLPLRPTRLRLVGPSSEWLMTVAANGTYTAATR